VPDRYLSVLFGVLVVLAALTSAVSPDVPLCNPTRVAGGVVSGIMGTAADIGGPPLALVYQSRSGPEVRSTLVVTFFLGRLSHFWPSRSPATPICLTSSSRSNSSPRSFWGCGARVM
jgi:hypothetical protein